jgi:hypothetical protein
MTERERPLPGLHRVGPVLILDGPAAELVLDALLIAARYRRYSGLPNSAAFAVIARVVAAAIVSRTGQTDTAATPISDDLPCEIPTIPIRDAAALLGYSPRQTRRLAPKLGGRMIGGRWLLDQHAITEHLEGKHG